VYLRQPWMVDSTSCVALELVRAAPDATIALEQA
jgi:hypothetical protein